MPGKCNKSIRNVSPHAGFLRPTIASLYHCKSRQPVTLQKGKRNGTAKKLATKNSLPSHSDQISHKHNSQFLSPVELPVYEANALHSSGDNKSQFLLTREQIEKNEQTLIDARKVCDELKSQINELRSHQENFDRTIKGLSFDENVTTLRYHNETKEKELSKEAYYEPPQNGITKSYLPEKLAELSVRPKSLIKANAIPEVALLSDSNNIPAHKHKNSEGVDVEKTSESIIQKLHFERDKYKRKVLKLQTELKMVKRTKEKLLKSPEISSSDVVFYNADMVGEGRLANVYEGTFEGKTVAVKKLVRAGLMSASDRSYLAAEAGLLILLHHQNIVGIIGVCSSPMEPLIVTEFVRGTTLLDILVGTDGGLDPASFFSIARDIALGMAYLHSQKPPVLHLNLRPSNVLVVDPYGKAKVADFGFSKIRLEARASNGKNLAYLAPELVKYPVHLTVKTDVFAFGILLWQMLTGDDPLQGRSTSQVLEMVQSGQNLQIPERIPCHVAQLIEKSWHSSPMQRPAFKEVILQLETMSFPDHWLAELKKHGLSRMDVSDLGSTTQESNSVLSTARPGTSAMAFNVFSKKPSKYYRVGEEERLLPTNNTFNNTNGHVSHHNHKPKFNSPWSHAKHTSDFPDKSTRFTNYHQGPLPCEDVRYVAHDIENEINAPEVVIYNKKKIPQLLHDIDHQHPYRHSSLIAKRYSDYPKSSQHNSIRGLSVQHSHDKPSKFDHKYRDFVSGGFHTESNSKACSYPNWTQQQTETDTKKNPSVSSDYIRIQSLSTPPESIATIGGKTGSSDTGLYPNPLLDYHVDLPKNVPVQEMEPDIRISTPPMEPHEMTYSKQTCAETNLPPALNSNSIITNAKRLLSTSTNSLHGHHKHNYESLSYQPGRYPHGSFNFNLSIKRSSVPKPASTDFLSNDFYSKSPYQTPLSSKSSTVSSESFMHLPPTIPSNHYTETYKNLGRSAGKPYLLEAWKGESAATMPNAAPAKASEVAQIVDHDSRMNKKDTTFKKRPDCITDILNKTAEQLETASCILHSAAEKHKKRKMMSGSI